MNRKIIIVGAVVIIVGVVIGGFFIFNQDAKITDNPKMVQENEAMMKKHEDNNVTDINTSRYLGYSKTILDQAVDKRRVLFFYASWCPTCKSAEADFEKNSSKIPEDVVVIRVNYNDPETDGEEKDLAKKYGITYQHTFVQIDTKGEEITKWNGGQTDELIANIE